MKRPSNHFRRIQGCPRTRHPVLAAAFVGVLAGFVSASSAEASPRQGPPSEDCGLRLAQAGATEGERDRDRTKRKRKSKSKEHAKGGGGLDSDERAALEAEVQRKLDTFLTVELSSQLGLDDAKALKLSTLLRARREARRQARSEAKDAYRDLKVLVETKAPTDALQRQTTKTIAAARRLQDDDSFLDETAKFLTAQEQARLVLAFPHLRKEMRRMMHHTRRQMEGRRAGPSPSGPDDAEEDF